MTRRPHRLGVRRATALAALLAVTATPSLSAASDGRVLARGRNDGGVCHFGKRVEIPRGYGVRADRQCRLVATPAPTRSALDALGALDTFGPAATHQAKVMDPGGDPNGGGGLGLTTRPEVANAAATATAAATDTATATTYNAWLLFTVYNERNQMMYDDAFTFTYRQSNRDGSYSGFAPKTAHCATGAGVYPYRPGVHRCSWVPGFLGGPYISLNSYGMYGTTALLAKYHTFRLEMSVTMNKQGDFYRGCAVLDHLPVGWWTPGCDIGRAKV